MKRLREIAPLAEMALRSKEDPLMQRAIDNMKTHSEVEREFRAHNEHLDKHDEDASMAICLRYNDPEHLSPEDYPHLDRACSHKIGMPITTFRGVRKRGHALLMASKPGDVVRIGGATSLKRVTAKSFSKSANPGEDGSIMVLHNLPGSRYGYISGHPEMLKRERGDPEGDDYVGRSEHEMLPHSSLHARYLGRHDIKGVPHHHLETIPDDDAPPVYPKFGEE